MPDNQALAARDTNDYLSALPEELLLRIFSFLDTPASLLNVSEVNHRFWKITQDKEIWNSLNAKNAFALPIAESPKENFMYYYYHPSIAFPRIKELLQNLPNEIEKLFSDSHMLPTEMIEKIVHAIKKETFNLNALEELLYKMHALEVINVSQLLKTLFLMYNTAIACDRCHKDTPQSVIFYCRTLNYIYNLNKTLDILKLQETIREKAPKYLKESQKLPSFIQKKFTIQWSLTKKFPSKLWETYLCQPVIKHLLPEKSLLSAEEIQHLTEESLQSLEPPRLPPIGPYRKRATTF